MLNIGPLKIFNYSVEENVFSLFGGAVRNEIIKRFLIFVNWSNIYAVYGLV